MLLKQNKYTIIILYCKNLLSISKESGFSKRLLGYTNSNFKVKYYK